MPRSYSYRNYDDRAGIRPRDRSRTKRAKRETINRRAERRAKHARQGR